MNQEYDGSQAHLPIINENGNSPDDFNVNSINVQYY